MSWYVEQLILHGAEIKTKVFSPGIDMSYHGMLDSDFGPDMSSSVDLESDDYNDLLLVEKAVKEMYSDELLNDDDIVLLNELYFNPLFSDLERKYKIPRQTISKLFTEICNRIGDYMGGMFTEEGYIKYITEKHSLNEEQIAKLKKFMKSVYKNKIMRGKTI